MSKLCDVTEHQLVKICSIDGDTRFLTRIISIGLTVGGRLKVIKNQKKQPILVYCRDTLIAINRKEGERIFVKTRVSKS